MSRTKDGRKGGYFKGKSHEECDENGCGIDGTIANSGDNFEFEGGEVILNATDMSSEEVITVAGTPKEIASAINSRTGNGVSFDKGATVKEGKHMKRGGELRNMTLYELESVSDDNEKILVNKDESTTYIYSKEGSEWVLYNTKDNGNGDLKKGTSHRMSKINVIINPYKNIRRTGGGINKTTGHKSNVPTKKINASELKQGDYLKSAYKFVKVLKINVRAKTTQVWYATAPDTSNEYHPEKPWQFPNNESVTIQDMTNGVKGYEDLYGKEVVDTYNKQLSIGESDEKTLFDTDIPKTKMATGGNVPSVAKSITENWNEVPVTWRNLSKINPVSAPTEPTDKKFNAIIGSFLSDDYLRPVLSGIHYTKDSIVGTDAHKLFILPNKTDLLGTYASLTTNKMAAKYESTKNEIKDGKIDAKFPQFEAVIPQSPEASYQIDVYKFLQYTQAAINYANKTTTQIRFKVNEEAEIGLNGRFTIETMKAALKLGHEKLWVHYSAPNRALIFTENELYQTSGEFLLLLMPVMLHGEGFLGAEDLDFSKRISAYYDFSKNEIFNQDGTVAEFKMNYGADTTFTKDVIRVIKAAQNKSNSLPILDGFVSSNGTVRASDLENTLILKGLNVPEGMYIIENNAAAQYNDHNVEDFPLTPKLEGTLTKFNISAENLAYILNTVGDFANNDDLRPTMSGIYFNTYFGKHYATSTNGHALCQLDITDMIDIKKDVELNVIVPFRRLKGYAKYVEGDVNVEISDINVKFINKKADWVLRAIDGKYPNYRAVIPQSASQKISTNLTELKKALKNTEATNFIKNNKSRNATINISGHYEKMELSLNLDATEYKGRELTTTPKEEIASITASFQRGDFSTPDNVLLLMPVKHEGRLPFFAFQISYFETVLSNLSTDTLDIYFNEENKAYLFHGASFDPKPKKVVKKKTVKVDKPAPKKTKPLSDVTKLTTKDRIKYDLGGRNWTDDIMETTNTGYTIWSFGSPKEIAYDQITAYQIGGSKEWVPVSKDSPAPKQDMDVQKHIDGLYLILPDLEGKEKKEVESHIEGLKLLLDDDLPFAKGGQVIKKLVWNDGKQGKNKGLTYRGFIHGKYKAYIDNNAQVEVSRLDEGVMGADIHVWLTDNKPVSTDEAMELINADRMKMRRGGEFLKSAARGVGKGLAATGRAAKSRHHKTKKKVALSVLKETSAKAHDKGLPASEELVDDASRVVANLYKRGGIAEQRIKNNKK